ncbi:MAG: DNA-3-methyladenine glycosylase [Patescibacteria group bacterium]
MVKKALDHFQKTDPLLFSFVQEESLKQLTKTKDLFSALCESIVSQQLSIKASDTIFGRLRALMPNNQVVPKSLIRYDIEKLRSVGMSRSKASYVLDLAQKIINKELILEELHTFSDEKVIEELIKVKGIGRWTAQMFLMFALGREDIFSYGDLGIRKAIQKMYKLKQEPTIAQAEKIAEKWKPYRTYACRILWNSL